MRNRKEISADGTRKDILSLEVLLDIRQLLQGLNKIKQDTPKRGRPRKSVCVKEVK